jgi:outer membrane protein OmpA-like peptidoglycan-associated protein
VACPLFSCCARTAYVHRSSDPFQGKVQQISAQTAQHYRSIKRADEDVESIDKSTESGVNFAQERASIAFQHALRAQADASEALRTATQAQEAAGQDRSALEGIGQAVSRVDNYELQRSLTLVFEPKESRLAPEAERELDQLAASVKSNQRFFLTVQGHGDTDGAEPSNDLLSWDRALSVAQYLVVKHEIPLFRIQYVGLGKPASATGRRREAPRNVQVEVYSTETETDLNPQSK